MSKRYSCHKISEGKAQAEAIKTHDRIMFYQVRPEDGVMEEKDHELVGRSIAKKVLLFPGGKGSSVVQQDGLYHLDRFHNMPAALIVQDPDPVLVAGAIIMEIPMVDRLPQEFYDAVKDDVITDLSVGDILYLASKAVNMDISGDIQSVPGEVTLSSDNYVEYIIDKNALTDIIMSIYYEEVN